ncbi:MAG: hypothetical protein BGO14_00845 [Chlamydiales bacterium 38-26]|nr:hypothetical protein [Chlamydiales bacterium]OJV07269.1 MAG: hypothetical protein BGO14_00845 [Chlamydiales bacterium 38-26]
MDKIIIELTKRELGVIINALNEVCNGIEVWEFDTRMGITIEDARVFLKSLGSLYKKIPIKEDDYEDE